VPDGLRLIVPLQGGVQVVGTARAEELVSGDTDLVVHKALRGLDSTVWLEIEGPDGRREIRRIVDGVAATSVSGEVELSGVGQISGRTAAVIIDRAQDAQSDAFGAVIVDYADGEQVTGKEAGAPEYTAGSVTVGGDRLVEGATVDLGENLLYYGLDGRVITDWFDPNDQAIYGAPPYFQRPIAAANGSLLTWVEGPDWDDNSGQIVGGWVLVIADSVTGTEALRLEVGGRDDYLMHADFDGRFWVGTFDDSPSEQNPALREADRVVVVDSASAAPALVDPECEPGTVATIDRA
jgi:hypothetical protein